MKPFDVLFKESFRQTEVLKERSLANIAKSGAMALGLGAAGLAGLHMADPNHKKIDAAIEHYRNPHGVHFVPDHQENEKENVPSLMAGETHEEHKLSEHDLIQFIKKHEGVSHYVYMDTKSHPSIGIGFNLDRHDALAQLKAAGVTPERAEQIMTTAKHYKAMVADGHKAPKFAGPKLANNTKTAEEITSKLVVQMLPIAIRDAKDFVGGDEAFKSYSPNVQKILIDMAYNMGRDKLFGFENMRASLKKRDFKATAAEMKNSAWYKQVKSRAVEMVDMMSHEK